MAHAEGDPGTTATGTGGRVIVADDDPMICKMVGAMLRKNGVDVTTVQSCAALHRMVDSSIDAVLLDLWMPDQYGIDCLRQLREAGCNVPVVMITGEVRPQHAVEAMKSGAFHYLVKPLNLEEVLLVTQQAIQSHRLRKENAGLREAIGAARFEREWVGVSPAARHILDVAKRVAASDATVLITGETGTGKSLMARIIHRMGSRADRPFITVSCAALPRELIDSELFGHEKGAYTGALRERPGRLEIVGDGTLFLDEIADLPLSMQPKVLRALQEREFERIGGNETRSVEARLIAATNQDLEAMCRRKEFREDLYYRVAVLRLHMPPLRDRIEDIPALSAGFLAEARHASGEPAALSADASEVLSRHSWPGNVRELQNVLERALAFAERPLIRACDLEFSPASATPVRTHATGLAGRALADIEAQAVAETLESCGGNISAAARVLGITPKTVHRKVKDLRLKPA